MTNLFCVGTVSVVLACALALRPSGRGPQNSEGFGGADHELLEVLEAQPVRSFEDFTTQASLYFDDGDLDRALLMLDAASSMARTVHEQSWALYGESILSLAHNRIGEATQLIESAFRLAPMNKELARMRLTCYLLGGDNLMSAVAASHLQKVDPEVSGDPIGAPLVVVARFGRAVARWAIRLVVEELIKEATARGVQYMLAWSEDGIEGAQTASRSIRFGPEDGPRSRDHGKGLLLGDYFLREFSK